MTSELTLAPPVSKHDRPYRFACTLALVVLLSGLMSGVSRAALVDSQAIQCSFSNGVGMPWVEVTPLTTNTPVGAVLWQRSVSLNTNYKYGGPSGGVPHELVSAGYWTGGTPLIDGIAPTNVRGIGFKVAANSSDGILRPLLQGIVPVALEKDRVRYEANAGQSQSSSMVTNYLQYLILTVPPSQLPTGELIVDRVDGSSGLMLYAVDLLKGVASLGSSIIIPSDNIPLGICRTPYALMGPAIINMGGGGPIVIPNTCTVEANKTIAVKLGDIPIANFPTVGATSVQRPFSIELSQCAVNARPNITFTDKSAGHSDPAILSLTPSPDTARGFGIIMINGLTGQRIKYDGTSYDMQRIGDGAQIPLSAGYIRTGSDAELTAGNADGAAEFTFTFP